MGECSQKKISILAIIQLFLCSYNVEEHADALAVRARRASTQIGQPRSLRSPSGRSRKLNGPIPNFIDFLSCGINSRAPLGQQQSQS